MKQKLIDMLYGLKKIIHESESEVPQATYLYHNYPNPFNPITNICFDLPKKSKVSLTVYNVKGQKVAKIIDDILEPGNHRHQWVAINSNGKQVASGVYFYRFETEDYSMTRKMLLLK